MRRGWLAPWLLILLISPSALAALRIGLPEIAPPFMMRNGTSGILDDELSILFSNSAAPEIRRFGSLADAVDALRQHQIDLLIAARPPAEDLQHSELMLTFPLASLSIINGNGGTICFPDLPLRLTPPCTESGSAATGENIQRLIQGEARQIIAPEFILRSWLASAPATTLQLVPQEHLSPLHFRGWALPGNSNALTELSTHIHGMNPEDADWLEEKWLLPTGSVFSARNPPANEDAPRLALKVLLPAAPVPLMQLTPEGNIRGVWYDLLLSLFPANHFSLSFGMDPPLTQLPTQGERARLRIVASLRAPSPDAIAFDALNWGLVSPSDKAISGALPALQNRRIAVIRHSPLATLLRQRVPAENLVLVSDLSQGFELMRAGGADGLAGDAYALNYVLRQRKETALQLTPLGLSETPLWFVPEISNPADARRVTAILASVTRADILNHRAKPLARLNEQMPTSESSLWLIMLAVVSFCAALVALIAWSGAQRQRRQREQDTSALHNALALWQTLMNNAPVPLFVCDPSGRLTRYNDAFLHSPQLASVPEEGNPFARLPLGELANQLALPDRLALLNAAHPLTGETRLSANNATLYWWLCRYTDDLGRPQGIVGGWVDISEKAALTAALNQALGQAERASREKSDFLARMSHDIRTPLNAVLGLLELEKEQNDTLSIAWQAAGNLRDLIGDILDLSRIEAGELRLEQAVHGLWQTLHASVGLFARSATDKGLRWQATLDIPYDALFYFDKARLNQIVSNLLGNAIKYTPQGEVNFDARLDAESLQMRIRDTGIGISSEAMPSIGQPWFQTDHTVPQSSGLGLAICYQLVELMGGSLTFNSTPGEGTEVTARLPLSLAAGQATPSAAIVLPPLPFYQVMVVDDFPANLTVMRLQLEKLGLQVITCENARAALARLADQPVDVLITDCQMPDIDGYQLTTLLLIREIAGLASAPRTLLGCTANALQEENDRARHAGMDALLRKPLTADALRQALAEHVPARDDTPDLTGLHQLADDRPEVIALMRQQMRDALEQDLQQLENGVADAEELSRLAHRLKASWSLFDMRETTRNCQALEALPGLVSAGLVEQSQLKLLTTRFLPLMRDSLARLDIALRELSDKY
uniref:ATP-binding protein n=1 Tax=Scandinavium goeteborgense TaxID=1851514 RepID=UPI00135CB1AD|nr:ATP-binding protein [Scandinavium goeteborgense]